MLQDRMKAVRESQSMTQDSFAKRIGVSKSTVSRLESGALSATSEPVIINICREFGVNYEWLTAGKGEMFVPSDSNVIDDLVSKHHLRPMERTILENFAKLPEEYRDGVLEHIKSLVAAIVTDNDHYQTIIDKQAEQENQALRENPAFDFPDAAEGDEKAHA